MALTRAIVQTDHGSRYLQQLCKHWSHKFEVAFDPEVGRIQFAPDQQITMRNQSGALLVEIEAAEASDLDRTETVVANHLIRFAFREELVFTWQRAEACE